MSAVMAEPAADAAPIRRPRKKILIVGALLFALVLALAAGTVVFLKQRAARAAAGEDEVATAEHGAAASHVDPKNVPIYLPLDPFVVNLADREADRYAQIGITFEVDSNASSDQVKAYMPAIRNAILLIVANKTSKEMFAREGKEQLAQELLRESARAMGIDVATPESVSPGPVQAASGAVAGASAALADASAPAKPKTSRHNPNAQRNPILHVHFSSFVIQ
jgi:flagellar protein FliL